MNRKTKKLLVSLCVIIMIFSTTGCSLMGNTKKTYAAYVQSLMDANYKAEFTEYISITGVTEEDAMQVYEDGIDYLADALMTAYGINDVEGSDIKSQFEDLAREIYSHAKYEITSVDKTDGVYTVTVTVYPIDILVISYEDVVAYIEDMNARVTAGDYNDYELDDYELEYAEGIIQILTNALPEIGNQDGVPITVTIQDNDEYYYLSDADFLELDKAVLATVIVNDDGTTDNTSSGEDDDTTDNTSPDEDDSQSSSNNADSYVSSASKE